MQRVLLWALLFFLSFTSVAQPAFKIGWNTYKAGFVVHEYTYN